MKRIDAGTLDFKTLNESVRTCGDSDITLDGVIGQRYIGCGSKGCNLIVNGTPGNALGSYLAGSKITVYGNAQDAVGDTMNDGEIIIHGSAGDGLGLSARGGNLFIRDSVGYRAGIHMKQYGERRPVLVIGTTAGAFLGEYLAGGLILVLNRNREESPVAGFCATGMHGGKIIVGGGIPDTLARITVREATGGDYEEIAPYIEKYCRLFGGSSEDFPASYFHVLIPDTKNPYRQLYCNVSS